MAIIVAGVAGAALFMSDDSGEIIDTTSFPSSPAITQPSPAATATAAGAIASTPDPLLPELLQVPALIRDRVRQQYLRGEITAEQVRQLVEQRSAAARAGVIKEIEPDKIEVQTYDGEDYHWQITTETAIRRLNQPATAADLKVGETVLILSRDGGVTAFSIESYGVLATP